MRLATIQFWDTTGSRPTGLAASGSATVESVQWIGEQALKVIYRDSDGQLGDRLIHSDGDGGVRVALTDQGLELVDRAIETRFEEALDAVSQLPPGDRVALGDLLRTLTASLAPTPRQEQST